MPGIRRWATSVSGLLLLAALPGQACAQSAAPVPAEYADLYQMLDGRLAAFEARLAQAPASAGGDVAFGAELLTANCNRGRQLLTPRAAAGARLELNRLQALGVQAVTVCIGFPLLYRPFLEYNGDPADYARFLAFYRELARDVHGRGMKLIVETAVLFPGVYSQGSGLKLREYYAGLSAGELERGRSEVVATIAREVQPDYLNVGSEPDTQARLLGRRDFASPEANARMVDSLVRAIRAAGGAGGAGGAVGRATRVGAGVGTWQARADAYAQALCGTGIDFVDLHVYPVNGEMLTRLFPLAEQAHRCGKQVAISEAWLHKERDSELATVDAAVDPRIFGRDAFSFWSPLDQRFLAALVRFSRAQGLLYLSPFWSKFLWAYLDYDTAGHLGAAELLEASSRAAAVALVRGDVSPTGRAYQAAIRAAPRP